mgnify:CR=1 FL=1
MKISKINTRFFRNQSISSRTYGLVKDMSTIIIKDDVRDDEPDISAPELLEKPAHIGTYPHQGDHTRQSEKRQSPW